MSEPSAKAGEGRLYNGRFTAGHKLGGPGNAGSRVNLAALAKRKAKELNLDLNTLLWDVMFAMLQNAALGDTKAAKIVIDALGEQAPKGPVVAIGINAGGRVPEAPPFVKAGADGAPPLGEHVDRLNAIIKERGLRDLESFAQPVDVVATIANRTAEEELLS